MELVAFILISIGIIAIPGPNVLVIVSTSISHGKMRGLQTVAGTSTAMILQLCIAAYGTAWLVASLAEGFFWLKWLGVAYLAYLGINHLVHATRNRESMEITASGSFHRGFWVSLTNPKTILFFSAFLPQFTGATEPYLEQIALLSFIFLVLATILDSAYALLSGHVASLLKNKMLSKYRHGASGLLFLGASAALAATKVRQ